MRLIFVLFILIFFQNVAFSQEKKDYFEALDIEIQSALKNKSKIRSIIDSETAKYKKTGEKKYLLSSKFAKLFLHNPNDIDLLSENYEIYSLDIEEYPYLSIRIQRNLAIQFSSNSSDKAIYFIDKAISKAKSQNYIFYMANLYQVKGNILKENKKNFDEAKILFQEALKYYKELDNRAGVASMNTSIGEIFYKQENYVEADKYFQIALQSFGNSQNLSEYESYILGGVKQNLGIKYLKSGDFENAEKNFLEALESFKTNSRYEEEMVFIIKELSDLYTKFSKIEKNNNLVAYIKNIEPKLIGTKNKITIANLLLKHYFDTNNKTEAQNYVNKLVELNRQNEKEWNDENRKITEILNKKIIDDIDLINKNKIENQRKKYFWITITSLLASAILVILFITSRNHRKREKLLFEKEKLIDEQNKIILEHNLKTQEEKIKNLHLNLNLKNQTEKAFLQKIKTMRKSSKNVDDMMKELYFNMHNLLQIDKKNSDFTKESYLQNKIFIEKLNSKFPKLNDKELQLCVYIRLGLEPKEIAIIENTTNGNIRVKKNTIKSKMQLTASDNLDDFLKNI